MIQWDETKRAANIAKHKVDFAAVTDFDWAGALVVQDTRLGYGEDRFQALGIIGQRLHMLVYTPTSDGFRVISLRKANNKEARFYGKSKGGRP